VRSSSLIHRLARHGHRRQPTGLGIAERSFGSALGADGAVDPPVQVEACLAYGIACLLQLSRHMIAPAVVHLIGSLATESGVGEPRIVLINVECHETPERGGTVERVQIEPLVLQRPPPDLDHGVGEPELGQGDDAEQHSGLDELVDISRQAFCELVQEW